LNEFTPPDDGEKWHGLFIAPEDFAVLSRKGTWGAVLREGSPLGHLVMVIGVSIGGLTEVRDPFDGTAYEMTTAEFLLHWGGEAIFKWKF
jgi:hypothetical protein